MGTYIVCKKVKCGKIVTLFFCKNFTNSSSIMESKIIMNFLKFLTVDLIEW